jgi:altronate dehydratase small subunit
VNGETIDGAVIVMAADDSVATALEALSEGQEFDVDGRTVALTEDIAFGHKFALRPLEADDPIHKYGEVIGRATQPIAAGEWVHVHNVESIRARPDQDRSEGSSR